MAGPSSFVLHPALRPLDVLVCMTRNGVIECGASAFGGPRGSNGFEGPWAGTHLIW